MMFTVIIFSSAKPMTQRPHLNEKDPARANQQHCCMFKLFANVLQNIVFITLLKCLVGHVSEGSVVSFTCLVIPGNLIVNGISIIPCLPGKTDLIQI